MAPSTDVVSLAMCFTAQLMGVLLLRVANDDPWLSARGRMAASRYGLTMIVCGLVYPFAADVAANVVKLYWQ